MEEIKEIEIKEKEIEINTKMEEIKLENIPRHSEAYLSRYKKKGKIEEGGGGTTYIVIHMDKEYVLKEAPKKNIESFMNEINVYHYLKSKCEKLITMHDYFIVDETYYIVIDYVKNSIDFFKFISMYVNKHENSRFYLKHIYYIILKVSRILKCLHEINVIHLDIKPENILLTFEDINNYETFDVYLIDYGLSCFYTNSKNTKDSISDSISTSSLPYGRYNCKKYNFIDQAYIYFAPELTSNTISQLYKIDKYTDIYSLGITMIVALFSRFGILKYLTKCKNNNQICISNVYKRQILENPSLEKELYNTHILNLISKMIDKYPAGRPTIEEIISILETI